MEFNAHVPWLKMGLTKTLKIMKITAILMLVACLSAAAEGNGQITLVEKNTPLQKVFSKIQKQSGYDFFYNFDLVEKAGNVTLNLNNVSLQTALAECLKGKGLIFEIINQTVVVKKQLLGSSASATEEKADIDITGKVTDENGNPLAGANVKIKGTNRITTTNTDGTFQFQQVPSDAILEISYAEFATIEVNVNNRNSIAISLTRTQVTMQDVVVNKGYYSTTNKLNTGSVSVVKAETIQQQPVSNPLLALSGRAPGMLVTQTSGMAGAGVKVEIRGRTSISPTISNDPLFVIDGVPFAANNGPINQIGSLIIAGHSPFNSINPDDIESIEILKDADATAIYGSRGANGVILITTKKGKSGKTKVSANFSTGWGKAARMGEFMNTKQYLEMRREAFANDGLTPSAVAGNPGYAPDLMLWDTTRYTDMQKLLHGGTARSTNVQLSLSGGNANTQFLLSSSFHRETSILPGNLHNDRGSFHANLNHSSNDRRFNVGFNAIYSADKNNLININVGSFILTLTPNVPEFYDSLGQLVWQKNGVSFVNPMSYLKSTYEGLTHNLVSNVNLGYKISNKLSFRSNIGYNQLDVNELSVNPIAAQDPAFQPTGNSAFANSKLTALIFEPQMEYKTRLSKGELSVLAGGTWQQNKRIGSSIFGYGFTSDALLRSPSAAPLVFTSVNSVNNFTYKYLAFFGRVNYNWDAKYLINLTGRRDGSSRFGPGKQFANFAAVGAGWIVSKEKFFQPLLNTVSLFKIRGSYGTSGNDKIGDYMFLDTYTSINGPTYQGVGGIRPSRLFNSDYAWEENKKLELALELGLFKDRLNIIANYYRNRSGNQLINYNLPSQTGGTGIFRNFPAVVQNSGVELSLSSTNIRNKNFQWESSFNITLPGNKLLRFPNLATSTYNSSLEEGESLGILGGYQYYGINSQTGVFQFLNARDTPTSVPVAADRVKNLLDRYPSFYGGFQNTFRYKNFDLTVFFEFRKQTGKNYYGFTYGSRLIPGQMFNQPVAALDRWRQQGDVAAFQRYTTRSNTPAGSIISAIAGNGSDLFYSDASYLRCKNVAVSYNIPVSKLKRFKIEQLRLYANAQNLFVITKYKGADPETLELTQVPTLRNIVVGIHANF